MEKENKDKKNSESLSNQKKGKMKRKSRSEKNTSKSLPVQQQDIRPTPQASPSNHSIPPTKSIEDVAKLLISGLMGRQQADEMAREEVDPNDLKQMIKQKVLNEHQVELLKSMVSEYLSNFIIMGYDMRGERVLITNATNSQDRDSMLQMAQTVPMVLFHMFNGPPM